MANSDIRLDHLPPLHSRSNPGSPDGACIQDDRRTTKHGARFRITVPKTDNATPSSASSAKASKPTGVFGKTTDIAVQTSLDQAPPPPLSRQILAVNVANISNKRPAIRHIVRNTRLWAISETCITSPNFALLSLDSMSSSIQPRDLDAGIASGIPSCFGGHEHGSAVGTMILAKVPNFTPECLWIVGSVYVGHSGATTNYSRERLLLVFGKPSTELFRLTTTILFSFSETGTPTRSAFSALSTRGTDSSGDHFVIRTSIRAGSRTTPCSSCSNHIPPSLSRSNRSNCYIQLLGCTSRRATDDTDRHRHHQLTSQFLESANAVADNLSLRLSPPATRSNRRFLSGTTKRAILASNTARQSIHCRCNPYQS
ncbi:hypothetical protein BASA83_013130 [Batrachochytrium salamandrivorans]|nr:hypothetical protein BASA83_013130 [Batrachochytrium salamandrivorans]